MDDLIAATRGLCDAKLVHGHGESRCRLRAGHEGEHSGFCDSCAEDDENPVLIWTEQDEDWTRRG